MQSESKESVAEMLGQSVSAISDLVIRSPSARTGRSDPFDNSAVHDREDCHVYFNIKVCKVLVARTPVILPWVIVIPWDSKLTGREDIVNHVRSTA
jgi:hypothetical protein